MALEDLDIYTLLLETTEECNNICESLKQAREFDYADQMSRAILSVSNNLAEGYGRAATGERLMFMFYADGSIQEVKNCLKMASITTHLTFTEVDSVRSKLIRVSIGLIELANWMLQKDPAYNGKYRQLVQARRAWRFKRTNK